MRSMPDTTRPAFARCSRDHGHRRIGQLRASCTTRARLGQSWGSEEMRKAVRRCCCREGCDNIKLDVSGDPFYPATPARVEFEEIRMAVETAPDLGRLGERARALDRLDPELRTRRCSMSCITANIPTRKHSTCSRRRRTAFSWRPPSACSSTMLHEASPGFASEIARAMGIDKLSTKSRHAHRIAQARHPPRDRRRLWLCVEQERHRMRAMWLSSSSTMVTRPPRRCAARRAMAARS